MTASQTNNLKRTTLAGLVSLAGFGILTPAVANAANVEPTAKPAASSDVQSFWETKGTEVTVRNNGDINMYVREWIFSYWGLVHTITPGKEIKYSGNEAGTDDLELNVFYDKGKADRNEGGINVDAENPA